MLRTVLAAATLIGVGWIAFRLESLMATQNKQLADLKASLTALFADIAAKLDQLNQQTDTFRPDAQATFDSLVQLVAEKQSEVGDVDGSDVPPVAEPGTF